MFYFSKIHKAISYNLKAFSKDIIKWTYSTGVRPCVEWGGQTWSRITLGKALHHGAAGQAGQNHGRHDLVHLH